MKNSCIEVNTLLIPNVEVNEECELIINHFSEEDP
jgi:hypothetical protein